jgi:peptide-methionine (R)-S-oxide reductase
MMTKRNFLTSAGAAAGAILTAGCSRGASAKPSDRFEVNKTPEEWKRILSPAAYRVLRDGSTERAGSSPLNKEKRRGTYACAGCGLPLFRSEAKYESGTGWPSFTAPIRGSVGTKDDNTLFMKRTEVHCRRCGGHLGHVFDDGPRPTGKRYCMNGVAMKFIAS